MDLALDVLTNDLAFNGGDLYFVDGPDAVRQFVLRRLRMFLGEWFLDETLGVPYHDRIFVKNPDPDLIGSELKKCIIQTPGVVELTSFSYDYDSLARTFAVTFEARSDDGPIDFNEIIKV